MSFIEIINYVVVYFIGMFLIIGSADWSMLPLAIWLVLLGSCCGIMFQNWERFPLYKQMHAR